MMATGPLRLGAIADDLTGATDLALTLSSEGMSVALVVGVPEAGDALAATESTVVALKSRTVPAEEAVAQSLAAARALLGAGAEQLYFKYCSTFDSTDAGNIGPVTDALLALLGADRTVACPAFPANGRTVYQGHLFVGDQLLSDSGMRDHPLTPMRDADLVRVLSRQSRTPVHLLPWATVAEGPSAIAARLSDGQGIAIVDALTEDDLRAIGRASRDLRLVTGSSGLAMGLPANFELVRPAGAPAWGAEAVAPGRSVVLAGSCSTATRRQTAAALAAGMPSLRVDPLDIVAGGTTPTEALAFACAAPAEMPVLVYSSAEPEDVVLVHGELGREQAGAVTEAFFAELACGLAQEGFTRFLVAGGETSGAVIEGLDIGAMVVGPEIAPGVPWMRTVGRREGLALALKSGNFGGPDIFLDAWERLS